MKKYINIKSLILVSLVGLLFLSCGGDKNQITLKCWQFWTDPTIKPVIESMVAEYETANPGIKIELTDLTWANGHEKIVVAFSSGTAPDIVELGSDWVAEFTYSNQLASMTEAVITDTSNFLGWSPGIYNDSIYAFPWILGTRVLYLNRDLMNVAGFDKAFIPVNLEEFKNTCMTIHNESKGIFGFGSNAAEKHRLYKKVLPFLWSLDGRIISKNGKYAVFSSDKAYKAIEYYKSLHDSCSIVDTQRRLEDAFLEGKIGVIISGDWLLKRIKNEQRNINFFTTLFPGPEYPGKSFVGGEYLAVSKSSPYKKEAIDFIKYITNRENQISFCKANYTANPSNKEATQDPFFNNDPNLQSFVKQLNLSSMPEPTPKWVYIEDIIETSIENILFNDAPIAETIYDANVRIQGLINDQ